MTMYSLIVVSKVRLVPESMAAFETLEEGMEFVREYMRDYTWTEFVKREGVENVWECDFLTLSLVKVDLWERKAA